MDNLTGSERRLFSILSKPGRVPTMHELFARLFAATPEGRAHARKLAKKAGFGLRDKQQRVGSVVARVNAKLPPSRRIVPTGDGRYALKRVRAAKKKTNGKAASKTK
jgi:hypothetical protein